jgi:hypothetical protein
MLKVLGFLTRRAGMEMQAFVDYYENTHVPLICSLAPIPSFTSVDTLCGTRD